MSKLDKLRKYLEDNIEINMEYIEEIKQQPIDDLLTMGGVRAWYLDTDYSAYYEEIQEAIKVAGYKYPNSDSVLDKAYQVKGEIVQEKLWELDLW